MWKLFWEKNQNLKVGTIFKAEGVNLYYIYISVIKFQIVPTDSNCNTYFTLEQLYVLRTYYNKCNLPIERAITSFSGFGSSTKLSTISLM